MIALFIGILLTQLKFYVVLHFYGLYGLFEENNEHYRFWTFTSLEELIAQTPLENAMPPVYWFVDRSSRRIF